MKNIKKDVLQKIQEQNIKPKPRWQFLLKSAFIKVIAVIGIAVGSIGFGIILFLFEANFVEFNLASGLGSFETIILSIPVVWILVLCLSVFIAFYNLKHSDSGYRYESIKVFAVSVVVSLLLGFVIYISGFSNVLSNAFADHIPYYSQLLDPRYAVWNRPSEGYLAGDIKELMVDSESSKLLLTDLSGKQWTVDYSNASVKGKVQLISGARVKIIGNVKSESAFSASEIRPWEGNGKKLQENL